MSAEENKPDVLSGFLMKRGEHKGAAYKRRYFKTEKSQSSWALNYFDSTFKPKGSIKMSEIFKIFWTREPEWAIELHTQKRVWELRLESRENATNIEMLQTLHQWVQGLNAWTKFLNPKYEMCDPPTLPVATSEKSKEKKTGDQKSMEGKSMEKKDMKSMEGKSMEKKDMKSMEGKSMEKKEDPKNMKSMKGKSMEGKSMEGKSMEGKSMEGKSMEKKEDPKNMKSMEGKSVEGKAKDDPKMMKSSEGKSGEQLLSTSSGYPMREKVFVPKESNPARIRSIVPYWEAEAVLPNGDFTFLKSTDFSDKYLVLFFYPQDFTQVCPTELIAFSKNVREFYKIDCEFLAVSVDTKFSHRAWKNTPQTAGGIQGVSFPLIADNGKFLSRLFNVYSEEMGVSYRATIIIDKNNVLRSSMVNDLPVGRSVSETLRLVEAFQYTDMYGEVCPADWKKGDDTIDTADRKKKFFQKTYGTTALFNDKVYKNEKMKGMEQFM